MNMYDDYNNYVVIFHEPVFQGSTKLLNKPLLKTITSNCTQQQSEALTRTFLY